MKNARTNKIRQGCEIALGVMSIALAIVYITQIADIYYGASGEEIFSRAIVWSKLKYLIAPTAVWLAAIIGCFVLSVVYRDSDAPVYKTSNTERVKRLRKHISARGDKEYMLARKNYVFYESWRYACYGIASAFAVAVGIYTVVYLCRPSNFASGEINDDILALVRNVVPFIAASFLLFIGAVVYEHAVSRRELNCMKDLLVRCKGKPIIQSPLAARMDAVKSAVIDNERFIVLGVRIAVFTVAAVFIGLGIANGGGSDVLNKAINLCMECVGMG